MLEEAAIPVFRSCVGGGEGSYTTGNHRSKIVCAPPPPPSKQDKTFCAPTLKKWTLVLTGTFHMAKTSSSHVETTSKPFGPLPPSAWLKLFPHSLFCRDKISLPPPFPLLMTTPTVKARSHIPYQTVLIPSNPIVVDWPVMSKLMGYAPYDEPIVR